MKPFFLVLLMLSCCSFAYSQEKPRTEKPKMQFMGAYDAGQPGVNIYKMFDPTEDVVCYLLMPEVAGRKQIAEGKWIYDANSVGSISCLKVRLPVVAIPPKPQK